MEPETHTPAREHPQEGGGGAAGGAPHTQDLSRLFMGEDGLRCGWSAMLFVALYYLLLFVIDLIALSLDPTLAREDFAPLPVLVSELVPLAAALVAGSFMARVEGRRLAAYNVGDARRTRHFAGGLIAGFATLSLLVSVLAAGGWLHFGATGLHGAPAFEYGALWACAFLLVGLFEEGFFRCYLLSTLTRGINFWWALATVAALCFLLTIGSDFKGSSGVFAIALAGIVPCWLVHRFGVGGSSFWQATWATSTAFAYFHTNNRGEDSIGILAAGLVGFVFCVSVRLTGSAWWAIGCHTAWDWAETYFYGTADSGFAPKFHLLTTTASGKALWSGGSDGPEGSVLVIPVILLLLGFLVAGYRLRGVVHTPAEWQAH